MSNESNKAQTARLAKLRSSVSKFGTARDAIETDMVACLRAKDEPKLIQRTFVIQYMTDHLAGYNLKQAEVARDSVEFGKTSGDKRVRTKAEDGVFKSATSIYFQVLATVRAKFPDLAPAKTQPDNGKSKKAKAAKALTAAKVPATVQRVAIPAAKDAIDAAGFMSCVAAMLDKFEAKNSGTLTGDLGAKIRDTIKFVHDRHAVKAE